MIKLRLDCLGRYGGLPMLWHDQTKVGNYDAAIRIPEQLHQRLEARQRKTLALFATRHNRPPTPEERAHLPLFPSNQRNSDSRRPLSYQWFHRGFKAWINDLDIGRWVPHQARHSLATSLLRAGASLTHIRRYLGQVSERMAEHYVHLAQSDLESVLQHVWVAGPGAASPGEILTDDLTPLTREHAMALASKRALADALVSESAQTWVTLNRSGAADELSLKELILTVGRQMRSDTRFRATVRLAADCTRTTGGAPELLAHIRREITAAADRARQEAPRSSPLAAQSPQIVAHLLLTVAYGLTFVSEQGHGGRQHDAGDEVWQLVLGSLGLCETTQGRCHVG
ncbi:tyrosine-type recombinase/integrase [Streptomyces sp. S1D4-11]|nr:tyrosine-type recombinase/integrase [Streptomyces sp. S1D4-11]